MEKLNADALPEYCPMRSNPDAIKRSANRYSDDDVKETYVNAAATEKAAARTVLGIPRVVKSRIEQLVDFGKLQGIETMGVAFCVALRDEASTLVEMLKEQGFDVASVCCKCGAADKANLGIPEKYKTKGKNVFEAACNPLLQAEILNRTKTQVNILVGLCVGHDMLFTKNSMAPVTTLIVKDRLLGHNPAKGLKRRKQVPRIRI
jgi:uncharacterized metal-binding protein